MHTDAIVTSDHLVRARAQLRHDGIGPTMDALQRTEPELFGFVLMSAHCSAGRLALYEVKQPIVRETADELLETVLTCLIAARMAQVRFWEEVTGLADQHRDTGTCDGNCGGGESFDDSDLPF